MTLTTRHTQTGFTLLEVVVAMTIIAIISAIALPKFSDTQDSAVLATIKNMRGTLSSATQLIYAKALAEELTYGEQTVSVSGRNIDLHSGYLLANWTKSVRYAINLDSLSFSLIESVCTIDWCARGGNNIDVPELPSYTPGQAALIWPKGYTGNSSCLVYYINREDGTPSTIGTIISGC